MPLRLLPLALAVTFAACGAGGAGGEPTAKTVTINLSDGERSTPSADEKAAAAAEQHCPGATDRPEQGNLERLEEVTLCLVNHERTRRDRRPLAPNRLLAGAAERKAKDMVERRYFAHVGPRGLDVRDWVRGTGYLPAGGYELGENLAWGPGGSATPASIVAGWMDSTTHRRNILAGEFEDSGIGIVAGVPQADAEPGASYVHFFGSQDPPG